MSESMFIHTVKPMQAQIKELERLGDTEGAQHFQSVYNRIKSGHIKTLTEMKRAMERKNGNS